MVTLVGYPPSITPVIAGSRGMFTQLHHTLSQGKGECVALSPEVKESLQA